MENGFFALAIEIASQENFNGSFFNGLNAISNPNVVTQIDIFLYRSVTLPIMGFIIGVVIFKLILLIVYRLYTLKDEFKAAIDLEDNQKDIYLGQDANEALFKRKIKTGSFRVAHLATHGIVNRAEPTSSCIVLCPDAR